MLAFDATGGILILKKLLYKQLDKMGITTNEEVELAVEKVCLQYKALYHCNDDFDADYGKMILEYKL
jgi:hypothetical protein